MAAPEQGTFTVGRPLVAHRQAAPESERELLVRALALRGKTVGELAHALGVDLPTDLRRTKGLVGQLAERALGADPKAGDAPDFSTLGIELKTIPITERGQPAESTFCCAIAMDSVDRLSWHESRLKRKLQRVLWLPVEAGRKSRGVKLPLAQRHFGEALLWSPNPREQAILRADWEDLIGAIGSGRTPTAHDGQWLQVRPKAANSRVRTLVSTAEGPEMALPLGFYLRAGFTAALLADRTLEAAE